MAPSATTIAQPWSKFLSHSLATRLDPETFESYVQLLSTKYPATPGLVADLFLRPTDTNNASPDPRISRYLKVLLGLNLTDIKYVLRAARKYSTFGIVSEGLVIDGTNKNIQDGEENAGKRKQEDQKKRWANSFAAEETLFYRVAKYASSGSSPSNAAEALDLLLICGNWMELVTTSMNGANEMLNIAGHAHAEEISATTLALAHWVVALVENALVLQALNKKKLPKGFAQGLSKTLANFISLLLQSNAGAQIAGRLELFRTQTLAPLEPAEQKQAVSKEIDDLLDGELNLGIESIVVADLPSMNSRAGLYVYLNALLVARPLIDDNAIFGYLHNRYQHDVQSSTIDLILASFDILANAKFRNEQAQTTTILRSFLINKVPLLLTTLSASFFPPLTPEYCITEALSHVDTNAFPTLSGMFDESSTNDMFSDLVRQDFCFACCLHGLLQETSIETLLGDVPMQSLPADGRYTKDNLVQQCLSDPQKVEGMIEELENMDGNVGAVCQAITEVIGRLCSTKETMSLKTLCSLLARKSSSLDIMLLFDKPTTILQPVCDLLDNWHYDEDQVEYQPVYEEFGSILLLVLAFVNRYNLSTVDLGIRSPSTSFVAKLLNQGHLSRAMENLTDQESSHLDGWIRGLFDSESGGLGDELMSSCPPQDFHLLVPTLFHHIVLACSTNNLSDESLKGCLELFLEPFLLPSLIPAITWLASHLWESRGDANAVLQILSALITNQASSSNNNDASQMLGVVINIVSKNLEHSLRWLQRAEPQRQDVEPLSKALRGSLQWERRGASEHTELETWTSTPSGGLIVAVKNTITGLVQWALHPGININPANYTHRQILVALKLLGAKRLLGAITDEVKTQSEAGNGPVVIDVATALICAPDAASWDAGTGMDLLGTGTHIQPLQRRMTLREALKIEAENAPKVHKTDAFHAETIVRLFRKVEAQMTIQQPVLMEDDGIAGLDAGALNAALDDMAAGGLGGNDGLGNGGIGEQSMEDVMNVQTDLMSGLLGGGDLSAGDLFGGMTGDDGMGDGMGF